MRQFFLSIILLAFSIAFAQKPDANSTYIMHVVKAGETIYQISRQYTVPVNEIFKVNPGIENGNIKPDQILRIPNVGNKKILTNSTSVNNELKPKESPKPNLIPKNGKMHTVLAGQTMYAVSKMYAVSVENIQKWNGIKDFNLKVGSQIYVVDPNFTTNPQAFTEIPTTKIEEKKPLVKQEPVPAKTSDTSLKMEEVKPPSEIPVITETETQKPDIQASDNATQKDLAKIYKEKALSMSVQTAKGTGAPMTTSLGTMETVYFAMHKWLPIATVIKIKNLVNSKVVYAKVIGKLPDTDENKHVIVRYSLGVKKDLQLQNGKCYLQIEYPN